MKKKSDGYPASLTYLGEPSDDPVIITNLFAEFFSQAFSNCTQEPDVDYFYYMRNCPQTSFSSINIDYDSVVNKICKLNDDYSCGPDGLPAIVLKKCVAALAGPLTMLYQNSLSDGVFPSIWKDSFIIPVPKKGCRSNISNYRPIAKLSCIPKLFESIVTDVLYFHCKPLFSFKQHGFLKGKSTTTNLIEFVSHAINTLETGKELDVVATDFSKAFDKISHKVIMFKLRAMGFPPGFLLWLESYLHHRKYSVKFRLSTSEPFTATSGVPQGSHLGPLIFILAINDVEDILEHTDISVYADDMKIFREISSPRDTDLLQVDLNNFNIWCKKNLLELNVGKCQAITYSRKQVKSSPRDYFINDNPVPRVSFIRDLGIVCDSSLNFKLHYDTIVNRANSALGFIKRWSKEFSNPYVTRMLYMTFVRPLVEYASQVWSPYQVIHKTRIEAVQRRFVLFALRGLPWTDRFNLPPYIDRLKLIHLHSLESRRNVADVVFIHQLLSGSIVSSTILQKINFNLNYRSLRAVPTFRPNTHRTDYGNNEPVTRMLRLVNLNVDAFDYNICKNTLKKRLFGELHS